METNRFLILLLLLIGACCPQPVSAQTMPDPPEEVTVNQLHLFVSLLGDHLQITEHYLLGNAGEAPYAGNEAGATVAFPLPADAENVRFEEVDRINKRYTYVDQTIVDHLPVPPGEATREVRFTYTLPYAGQRSVQRTFLLPVDAAVVMVTTAEISVVESPQLTPLGTMSPEQSQITMYAARRPLATGESLTFTLAPQASPTAQADQAGARDRIGWEVGLGALALAGALAWGLRRTGRGSIPPPPAASRSLIEALARLDAAHASGNVPDDVYRRQHAALRADVRVSLREAWGHDRDP